MVRNIDDYKNSATSNGRIYREKYSPEQYVMTLLRRATTETDCESATSVGKEEATANLNGQTLVGTIKDRHELRRMMLQDLGLCSVGAGRALLASPTDRSSPAVYYGRSLDKIVERSDLSRR